MKYVPPLGVSDPNASYVNGDPSIARQGSIPPAPVFENPQREIINVITNNSFIPNDADLDQMFEATRSQWGNFLQDTGSVNTLSVAAKPPLPKYTVGLPLRVRVNNTNTSACSIDAGCGRVPIRRMDGSNLQPGDLPAGGVPTLVFDGNVFQVTNFLGTGVAGGGDTINNYSNIPFAVDTSATPNVIIAPFSPALTTLKAGDPVLVKIANTTTGPTTLQCNTLPAYPVRANSAGDLLQGDLIAGDVKLFTFDGTQFYVTPNLMITANVTLQVPGQYADPPSALAAIARKRISTAARVTINVATGSLAPFSIYHVDADRITIQGTMKAAAPGYADLYKTNHPTLTDIINNGWNNLTLLQSRYGTVMTLANGQIGIINVGPGNPAINNILILGPFNVAKTPGNPNSWWDGSSGIWCPPNRSMTCTNVAVWGVGWAGYEGQGMLTTNSCISTANINGQSSRTATGRIDSNADILIGNSYTGVNADEQSEWRGTNSSVSFNLTDGLQPVLMGLCLCSGTWAIGNSGWDVQSIDQATTEMLNGNFGSANPPMNGGPGMNGSYNYFLTN